MPLLDYARMIWRRRLMVLSIVVVMAGAAAAYSLTRPPSYQSTAVVALGQQRLDDNYNSAFVDLTDRQMTTQVAVMSGDTVRELAVTKGATMPALATTVSESNLMTVTVDAPTAAEAAKSANAYVTAYIQYRADLVSKDLEQSGQQLRRRMAFVQDQIDPLVEQVNDAPAARRAETQLQVQPALTALQQQMTDLQSRLGLLQTQRTMAPAQATVVQKAPKPLVPASPQPIRDTIVATILALMIAASLAVLREAALAGQAQRQAQPPPPPSSVSLAHREVGVRV